MSDELKEEKIKTPEELPEEALFQSDDEDPDKDLEEEDEEEEVELPKDLP